MASTPMDVDEAPGAPSLNITRTLVTNIPSTSKVSDVIQIFRPTKVGAIEPFVHWLSC